MDLSTPILGNTLIAWSSALALTTLVGLGAILARSVGVRHARSLAERTQMHWDDALVDALERTRLVLIAMIALYLGSRLIVLPHPLDVALRTAAVLSCFLQIGLWANALLASMFKRSQQRLVTEDIGAATSIVAFAFVGQVLVWGAVALLALANVGVDVTALVAGLGIGGIAVALAVQNILGDLFASFSIVIDKPFSVGDFIVIDGYMGTVERVGIKTTRVRSLSGEQLVFANSDLLKARLRNYKRMQERRVVFAFGVLYRTTPEQLERIPQLVRTIVESQPGTRFDRAHFKGFGESSLDFEVVYWMLEPDFNRYMDTQQAINLALLRAFAADSIDFAYPTRTLVIESELSLCGGRATASR